MADTTWKATERRVAKRVGSTREGATGDSTYDVIAGEDYTVDDHKLGIEVKYRKSVPQWLVNMIQQAWKHQRHAWKELGIHTDPIVVLAPAQSPVENMVVMMRFGDYLNLRKRLAMQEEGKVGGTE